MIEKSVSPGSPKSSGGLCRKVSGHHKGNGRVERDASMAIGAFSHPLWGTTDNLILIQLLAKHKYLTGDDIIAVMDHYENAAKIGIGTQPHA